jgi:hypothetical protein
LFLISHASRPFKFWSFEAAIKEIKQIDADSIEDGYEQVMDLISPFE